MINTIIIGGGVSGLMASVTASSDGHETVLIEKNKNLGRKLLISGGGRCNVTNRLPYEEIIKNIPGNGKFLYGPFSVFDNEDIIEFVESRGVKLKEEDHGRMFPVSNKAKDVLQVFLDELDKNNVHVYFNTVVESLMIENDEIRGVVLTSGEILNAKNVIVTTGGKSVPATGSSGDGHKFARFSGHTVTKLFPTEVPILSDEPFIKDNTLKGISLKDVALSVLKKNGKPRITHQMDMIFTHFGISGPAALRCSQFVLKEQASQKRDDIKMMIDFYPEKNFGELQEEIDALIKENKDKVIGNILKPLLQARMIDFMLEHEEIDKNKNGHNISNDDKKKILHFLKSFIFTVNGTQSIEKSFVTGGGVNLKEITPKTMESKIVSGLHFAGEVLDIHGYTGGYNITSALVTGYVAGNHCK